MLFKLASVSMDAGAGLFKRIKNTPMYNAEPGDDLQRLIDILNEAEPDENANVDIDLDSATDEDEDE